jgi:ribosomal protein S6
MKDAVIDAEVAIGADPAVAEAMAGERGAEPTVYELGYHILPTLSEEAVQQEVNAITEVLKSLNVEFVAEKLPVRLDLAYTIEKKIDGANRRFESAYFGWVAFTLQANQIGAVKTAMDHDLNILRYLIVKTSRDAVAANMAEPTVDISTKALRETEVGGEVSEVALDTVLKQIEADDVKTEEKS